jgi:hypothetical protein
MAPIPVVGIGREGMSPIGTVGPVAGTEVEDTEDPRLEASGCEEGAAECSADVEFVAFGFTRRLTDATTVKWLPLPIT